MMDIGGQAVRRLDVDPLIVTQATRPMKTTSATPLTGPSPRFSPEMLGGLLNQSANDAPSGRVMM